ncbi:protein FAR1-RELATED SEQUENCE 2 isoform X3 [Vigna angularis]|uniref:protein FAR1-RELATED SEQUENCE 2 isoform X3 n=1 Tax=Phaseolus angularis TaxID=3914 RepID=UPI0022B515F4|nr:protein FAR1-RELATED SEQUENCE 2 isoform X3 [Vigna angularis]
MDIDLEVPICEHEKLNIGSSGNNLTDTTCDICIEEHKINPSSMTAHCKEVLSEKDFCCQDPVDLNSNQVDAIDRFPIKEPQNGLEFESKEAAYSFYREYARLVGFGITIKASRRSKKSGKFIDIKIVCSRFGSKRESGTAVNPRPCTKTDCKAGMHMKKKIDGNWIIYNFVKEHNHEICPDDFVTGRSKQISNLACRKKGMQLALDEGDVQLIIEYFISMQCENPNFFYAIDLDQDRHLRTVFWVDSKGIFDYKKFHDIVLIDTFYLKNKYKIPFVPFVGVNHHFQYILLGCALVGEESVSAFMWLMQAWLKAMSNLPPEVIITDQEQFLKEAVMEVFPDKHHCFCLSHVLCKITKNLDYIINENNNFMENFDKCIHHYCSDEKFEERWWKLMNRIELKDDELVRSLYEDRKKWAPTFMRDISLVGLSTIAMEEMYKHCVNTKYSARSTSDPNKLALDAFDVRDKNYGCNRAKPTKKRKSFSKRESSDPERINIKMMDDLRKREQRITRAHNFNNCYIYQQNMQTVDLDSRASTLDAYYGTQQSVLEDGQLHSIASRGPHYGMQHRMQRPLQGELTFRTPTVQGCFDLQDSLEAIEEPVKASQFHDIASKQLEADKSLP